MSTEVAVPAKSTVDALMPGHETTFLIDTVGDALAKGVAATVAAQPSDPVEYLAEWLLR